MKSSLYIVLLLFSASFLGCSESKPNESIWIEAFSLQNNGVILSPSGHKILELFRDKALLVNFNSGAPRNTPFTTIDTLKYNLLNSTINFEGKETKVNINNDTLKLELDNNQLVFYKLKKQWKTPSKIDLIKKEIHIKNQFTSLNYEFINDSILIQFSENENDERYPFKKWSVREYKDYKFFVIHSIFYPQSIITNKNLTLLMPNHEGFIKETTKLISPSTSKINISGKWKEVQTIQVSTDPENKDTIFNTNIFPGPPPPPPSVEPIDYENFTLKINSDSISINRYGHKNKQTWQLSSNKKRLYLSKYYKQDGLFFNSWQIIGVNDTILTFKMNTKSSSMSKDIITFKKVN